MIIRCPDMDVQLNIKAGQRLEYFNNIVIIIGNNTLRCHTFRSLNKVDEHDEDDLSSLSKNKPKTFIQRKNIDGYLNAVWERS